MAATTAEASPSIRVYLNGQNQHVAMVLELLQFCLPFPVGANASRRPVARPSHLDCSTCPTHHHIATFRRRLSPPVLLCNGSSYLHTCFLRGQESWVNIPGAGVVELANGKAPLIVNR